MRSNRLIPAVAIAGLAALSTNARALEPERDFSKMLHPTGVIPMPEPPPDLTVNQVVCTNDADCDDGSFCNGQESCDVATGRCLPGTPPCATFEGYVAPCNDNLDLCTEPDPCFTWIAGAVSGYFFPEINHCPDLASWVFDDVQGSHHTTGVLDFYTTPILARSTPTGASPLGALARRLRGAELRRDRPQRPGHRRHGGVRAQGHPGLLGAAPGRRREHRRLRA